MTPMSLRLAVAQRLKTFAVFCLLTSFSLFLLWEILRSASSGCIGDVVSRESCRPDPLMNTYDLSGREVLPFWDVYSGKYDGKVVMTCGFVSNDGRRLRADRFANADAASMRLDRPIQPGPHCFLAKVSRYSGPSTPERSVAFPADGAVIRGTRLLEIQKILPPY
jgi:hypothetical protein